MISLNARKICFYLLHSRVELQQHNTTSNDRCRFEKNCCADDRDPPSWSQSLRRHARWYLISWGMLLQRIPNLFLQLWRWLNSMRCCKLCNRLLDSGKLLLKLWVLIEVNFELGALSASSKPST